MRTIVEDLPTGSPEAPVSDQPLLSISTFTIAGYLVFLGGFLSYTQAGLGLVAATGYIMALLGLGLSVLVAQRFPRNQTIWILAFGTAFALSSLISAVIVGVGNVGLLRLGQELSYPLGAVLTLLGGVHILKNAGSSLGWLLLFLAVINFVVALGGVSGQMISAGPFGPVTQGRFIFGTALRSSNGLMLNVNYFAVTQSTLGFLYALFQYKRFGVLSTWDKVLVLGIVSSSVIGSSRGVMVSLLVVAIVLLLVRAKHLRSVSRLAYSAALLGAGVAGLASLNLYSEELRLIFRLDRGLNRRDEIWTAVLLAWLERPLLGWSVEATAALGVASEGQFEGTSAHSGYLHTLNRGGLIAFLIIYGFIGSIVVRAVRVARIKRFQIWIPLACVLFYGANALFRTYSVGGLGLLPLLLGFSLSVLLFQHSESATMSVRRGSGSGDNRSRRQPLPSVAGTGPQAKDRG